VVTAIQQRLLWWLVTPGHKMFFSSSSGFCPFLAEIRGFSEVVYEVTVHFLRSDDRLLDALGRVLLLNAL
jgi:hypothetical protein